MDKRLLPIGIQTFREEDCYYVDRTAYSGKRGRYERQ